MAKSRSEPSEVEKLLQQFLEKNARRRRSEVRNKITKDTKTQTDPDSEYAKTQTDSDSEYEKTQTNSDSEYAKTQTDLDAGYAKIDPDTGYAKTDPDSEHIKTETDPDSDDSEGDSGGGSLPSSGGESLSNSDCENVEEEGNEKEGNNTEDDGSSGVATDDEAVSTCGSSSNDGSNVDGVVGNSGSNSCGDPEKRSIVDVLSSILPPSPNDEQVRAYLTLLGHSKVTEAFAQLMHT